MAADKSETQALWHSARRYALGDGVEFDWEKATHLLKEAASLALSEGNPDYAFQLGRILTTGIYYSDAEDEVGSDAEGQLCLPPCPTVPVDEAEAEIWFRRAWDAGHNLAGRWFDLAKTDGLRGTELLIEMAYENGFEHGFMEYPWLLAGCDRGDAKACMELSSAIWDRLPRHKFDWVSRIAAYRKGRELGHAHAPITLEPTFKNASGAAGILQCAQLGSLVDQVLIGEYYAGQGPDHVRAYAWLANALENPDQRAMRQAERDEYFVSHSKWYAEATLWFLRNILDTEELRRANSLAGEYRADFPPRKLGILLKLRLLRQQGI